MKKILASLTISFASCTHILATSSFDFDLLPEPLALHTCSYMEEQDALRLTTLSHKFWALKTKIRQRQLPNIYRNLGLDFSQVRMDYGFLGARLNTEMPEKVKSSIHEIYLAGRKIAEPVKKYSHLMAAGMRGHHYAAHEAGQMLLTLGPDVIPVCMTQEEMAEHVPELKDPEFMAWTVSQLQQPLITDPQIEQHYQNLRKIIGDTGFMVESIIRDAPLDSHPHYEFMQFEATLTACINNLKALYQDLSQPNWEKNDEAQIFKTFINMKIDIFPEELLSYYIPQLKEMLAQQSSWPTEAVAQLAEEHRINHQKHLAKAPQLIKDLEKKLLDLPRSEIKEFELKHSSYTTVPLYWKCLSVFYDSKGKIKEKYAAMREILKLKLNSNTLFILASDYFQTNIAGHPYSNEFADKVVNEERLIYLCACILGDIDASKELTVKNSNMMGSTFGYLWSSILEGTENKLHYLGLYKNLLPLEVFALQLNYMKHPSECTPYIYDLYTNGTLQKNSEDTFFISPANFERAIAALRKQRVSLK
jgi:hypothetical protein